MPSLFKTISFVVVITGLSLAVFPAMAQLSNNVNDVAGKFNIVPGNDLRGSVANIVNWFLSLLGLVAVLAIIYGGIQYVTSQGNEGKAEDGKRTIIFAIIGLLIVGIAAVVVNFVLSAIGQA